MGDGYKRFIPVREFDKTTLHQAREVFEAYKKRKVIVGGEFDDMSWTLSDEARKVGLTLLTFEGGSKKPVVSWIGCSYPRYVVYVKSYIVFHLGEITLASLQELTRCFNRLALATAEETAGMMKYAAHVVAFLQFIPGNNHYRDAVIEELEERMALRVWSKRDGNQRNLADFKSYLRFHEVLRDFWASAGKRQKMFYFPLYYWWNLTAILPLRPMELLLTPRDCLRIHNGENILTIRRTKLKGGNKRIQYRIADDYTLNEYVITESLAEEIRKYAEATKGMKKTELKTLLLQEPHFNYTERKIHSNNRYYTYNNLTVCRNYFFQEIGQAADTFEIRFGDTRHLAMVNLILSGGSPIICRELAGHTDIDISSHYYSNISTLVECMAIEQYRNSKGNDTTIHGSSKYHISLPKNARAVSDGQCTSEAYINGRIDDCLKVGDGNRHIGDCRYCDHYIPNNQGVAYEHFDVNAAKRQVDGDSRYLISMIELVRKGLGYTEDITSAILRLQHSGHHYSKCLLEQYAREEISNG